MASSPVGSPLERHAPAEGFTRTESGGGRTAAQLAAMNVVDRVRIKMVEAAELGARRQGTSGA